LAADASYLESITEDIIYENYREAIICDHTRTFTDFKQEHRDAYLRLKMRGMRPASIIPPVFIKQRIGAVVEEEEKKSSDPKIVEPLSLNSLNFMITKMDQKLIISSTLCEAQMKKLKEMTIAVSKRLTKAKQNSNRIIQVNKR
jgi:hypothetical protein